MFISSDYDFYPSHRYISDHIHLDHNVRDLYYSNVVADDDQMIYDHYSLVDHTFHDHLIVDRKIYDRFDDNYHNFDHDHLDDWVFWIGDQNYHDYVAFDNFVQIAVGPYAVVAFEIGPETFDYFEILDETLVEVLKKSFLYPKLNYWFYVVIVNFFQIT